MRIDKLLVAIGFFPTRHKAQDAIRQGNVFYKNKPIKKPSTQIPESAQKSDFKVTQSYNVSRAADKLKHALETFHINVSDKVCLDVGASTGGFTQILLKNNASKVYAVDVGTNQLDPILKSNPKLISIEQTDIRNLTPNQMPEQADFFCIDVSFISVLKILPSVKAFLSPGSEGVILFKPQFEVGKELINKKGYVGSLHAKQALNQFKNKLIKLGFELKNTTTSPILGYKSLNQEILIHIKNL